MIWLKRNFLSLSRSDAWLFGAVATAAAAAGGLLLLIVMFLLRESSPVLERIGLLRFFADPAWRPTEGAFGLAPMALASLAATSGALLIALPLGVASAVFVRFYAPPAIGNLYRWVVILLAGIPSVVLGLWGLTVIVPLIAVIEPPGASLLVGILVLALMVLPIIVLTTEAALEALPSSYWRGAAALGLSKAGTILGLALPAARNTIFAGALLAASRALGETMVVLMVTGNVVQIPSSLFDPVRTLTANIALEMAYATDDHRAALFLSGLALTALVFVLVVGARRSERSTRHV